MNARADLPMGLIHSLPNEQYHGGPGVSNSGLRDFARSPAHYYALHLDPERPPRSTKAGQLEGTLAHCAVLEPGQFSARYVVGPDCRRGTKLWDAFEDGLKPGQIGIKEEQRATAFAQAKSVRALPDVAKLLSIGRPEVSAFWIDPVTGELCRCRPDWVHPVGERGVILVDVKTYSDASPHEFARQVARKGYHAQAAFYSDGYSIASGLPVVGFVFVAVETEWPYAACAVMLDDEGLDKGREINRELLNGYAACRGADSWPGYSESIELITLPRWAA